MQTTNKQMSQPSKEKQVSGFKRSYREFLNQSADHKNIVVDVELIYHVHQRKLINSKSMSSSESVKEERESKKDVGFGFKY